MKTVAVFGYLDDAQIAASVLRANGIDAFLPDEFTVTWMWTYTNAIGGIRVQVDDEDFELAREALTLAKVPELEPRCPHCHAAELRRMRFGWWNAAAIFLGFLIPGLEAKYQCQRCRNKSGPAAATHEAESSQRLEAEALSVPFRTEQIGPLPPLFRFTLGAFLGIVITTLLLPLRLLAVEPEITIADSYLLGAAAGGVLGSLLGVADDWRLKHGREARATNSKQATGQ